MTDLQATAFETKLGWMAAVGHGHALHLLKIGFPSAQAARRELAAELGDAPRAEWSAAELIDLLRRYAEGEPVRFDSVELDLSHLTAFQRRVIDACRGIEYGHTTSYGQLAAVAGSPGAARAVGNTMRRNRHPLLVPCHRVLAAGGALGGFSAPEGVTFKKRLLALETQPLARLA